MHIGAITNGIELPRLNFGEDYAFLKDWQLYHGQTADVLVKFRHDVTETWHKHEESVPCVTDVHVICLQHADEHTGIVATFSRDVIDARFGDQTVAFAKSAMEDHADYDTVISSAITDTDAQLITDPIVEAA